MKLAATGATILLVAAMIAGAQVPQTAPPAARPPRAAAKDYPRPASFPKEDRAAVAAALSRARKVAGDDLFSDFIHRCIISPKYNTRVRGIQHDGFMEPARMFDNLYSVGQNSVSAFALVTSEGIVLIDTLNNEDEAQTILVPNLQAVGLDPKNIKYIVISHGHGDHYGGAAYLARTYGARVLSSKIDWDAMDTQRNRPAGPFAKPPARDMEVADGQTLKVGDTGISFHVTPGHTNGTLSMIFPVREGGRTHTVGYFGGTGGGGGPANLRNQVSSIERWLPLAKQAGVDVLVANHPLHDRGIENNEILRYRLPGESNPYVIGNDRYQRYFAVQQECARVQLARLGEKAP